MSNLLTSKKKIDKGVWGYRGYVITKDEKATDDKVWVITQSPSNKDSLDNEGKRVIKDTCLFIDEKLGDLTDDEKPQPKEKKKAKAKPKPLSARKTHLDKAVVLDKCGLIYAKIKDDMKIFPGIRKTRGNTVKYIWNSDVRQKAEELNRDLPSKTELLTKYMSIIEKHQLQHRDFSIDFDGETMTITYKG